MGKREVVGGDRGISRGQRGLVSSERAAIGQAGFGVAGHRGLVTSPGQLDRGDGGFFQGNIGLGRGQGGLGTGQGRLHGGNRLGGFPGGQRGLVGGQEELSQFQGGILGGQNLLGRGQGGLPRGLHGGQGTLVDSDWRQDGGQVGLIGSPGGLLGGHGGLVRGQAGLVGGREGLVGGREGLVGGREGLFGGHEGLVGGREGLVGGISLPTGRLGGAQGFRQTGTVTGQIKAAPLNRGVPIINSPPSVPSSLLSHAATDAATDQERGGRALGQGLDHGVQHAAEHGVPIAPELLSSLGHGAPVVHVAPPVHGQPHYDDISEILPFQFSYSVHDDQYGTTFQQHESDDGTGVREGEYSVQLPDGRTQHVTYHTNDYDGYVAEVTYKGEAVFPDHLPLVHEHVGQDGLIGGNAIAAGALHAY